MPAEIDQWVIPDVPMLDFLPDGEVVARLLKQLDDLGWLSRRGHPLRVEYPAAGKPERLLIPFSDLPTVLDALMSSAGSVLLRLPLNEDEWPDIDPDVPYDTLTFGHFYSAVIRLSRDLSLAPVTDEGRLVCGTCGGDVTSLFSFDRTTVWQFHWFAWSLDSSPTWICPHCALRLRARK